MSKALRFKNGDRVSIAPNIFMRETSSREGTVVTSIRRKGMENCERVLLDGRTRADTYHHDFLTPLGDSVETDKIPEMKNNRFSLPVPPGAIKKLPQIVSGFPHVTVAVDGLSAVMYAYESRTVILVEGAGDELSFEILTTGSALSTKEIQDAVRIDLDKILESMGS